MARIRTVKPDFFTAPGTASVDFAVRIFYQALWCNADDFGIGETNLNTLLGLAFPDSDGFTAQDVRRFCADCARAYETVFYTVRGRHYYAIPSWEKHQKLERREDRRKHPLPTDPDATPDLRIHVRAESAPTDRRESGAESVLEEEREGEGDSKEPPYPPTVESIDTEYRPTQRDGAEKARARFASIPRANSDTAREITQSFSDAIGLPLDAKTRKGITNVVDDCLQAGQLPQHIAAGMQLWSKSGSWAPSQIPMFITKAAAQGAATTNGDEKVNDWHATANATPDQKAIGS